MLSEDFKVSEGSNIYEIRISNIAKNTGLDDMQKILSEIMAPHLEETVTKNAPSYDAKELSIAIANNLLSGMFKASSAPSKKRSTF